MKSVARLGLSSLLILAGALSATSAAAQTADPDFESKAATDLKWSTRKSIPGPSGTILNTSGSGYSFNISVGADLDAVGTPVDEPLLLVDMPTATVKASWNDNVSIGLSPIEGTLTDALFQVHNTLAPHIHAAITLGGASVVLNYTATQLVARVPGSQWKYNGFKKVQFDPWAFAGVVANVPADPADLMLVSTSLNSGGLAGGLGLDPGIATGALSINGQIDPEQFTYTTKSVKLGTAAALAVSGGQVTIPTVDTDFIDLPVVVVGEITYAGHVKVGPAISLNSIAGVGSGTLSTACSVLAALDSSLSFLSALPSSAGCLIDLSGPARMADLPYDSATLPGAVITVTFPSTVFHIALPNVKLANTLDLGAVTLGMSKKDTAQIKNTGEKAATLAFKSSDPQFVVTATGSAAAKSTFGLDVTFTPVAEGPATATITVTSNDPNEPVQTIQVTASGTKVVVPPVDNGSSDADAGGGGGLKVVDGTNGQPSGCGCKVVNASTGAAPYGMFAFAALGLGLAARRRRR